MPFSEYSKERVSTKLAKLNIFHQLAFGASCCERLLPNYIAYFSDTGNGDVSSLRDGLEMAWKYLLDGKKSERKLEKQIRSCLQSAPYSDTDGVSPHTGIGDNIYNAESPYVTYAGNSCFAICHLLEFIQDSDRESIVSIATLSTDTVDMYVQEYEGLFPNDPYLESKILNHPLMQRELKKQNCDLEVLKNWKLMDRIHVEKFRSSWNNSGMGNLDISIINPT